MSQQFFANPPERTTSSLLRGASFGYGKKKMPPPIVQLQHALGNRRIAELIHAKRLTPEGKITGLQRKLTVGAADDQYEQEADHVARQVMSMPDATPSQSIQADFAEEEEKALQTKPLTASITPFAQRQMENTEELEEKAARVQTKSVEGCVGLQRQPEMEEEETEPVQGEFIRTKSSETQTDSFDAGADVESQLNRSKGSGSQLPDTVRAYMEPRFGMDFGHVRVHTGSEAVQMNRDVSAKAFTHGSDIYYGAGNSPGNLELTAHELTHVLQQTGNTPLQPKRLDEKPLTNADPSIRRTCKACSVSKEEKKEAGAGSRVQAKQAAGFASSVYTAQRLPAVSPVHGRTVGPLIQGAWTLTETVSNTKPVIGDRTRENGSTFAVPNPTGVYGKVSTWQKAGFWQIYGGNAHLVMRRDTRYTFVHTGADNNLLTLRGGASIFGGAEADDMHYAQAGAAIAGNIAVRTVADPAPKQKSLFPPIHDGGRSEAKKSSIGEVDVSLPVGDATVDVNIPLTKTDEGELAALSESMPFNHDVAGGSDWKSVDVYLVAYIELAADIENEFWGTDGDVNWAHAAAQYSLTWQERPVPAPPDEEGEEGEILVKRRCWSGRDCDGKAYNQKFSHCHNCKNYASGKSLGEPGNCERC